MLCYTRCDGAARHHVCDLPAAAPSQEYMSEHETSTRERRFAETMARVNASMHEFLVLIEEQVTSVNAPHQIAMLELLVEMKQVRRDLDALSSDVARLAEIVDALLARREVGS